MKQFWQDMRGAAALEFALLAVPLISFTLIIIELSRALFMQQSLSYAVDRAAREVYLRPANTTELCDLVFAELFFARRDRFYCVPPDPPTTGIGEQILRVDYKFSSVVPTLLIDMVPLRQERIIIVDNSDAH